MFVICSIISFFSGSTYNYFCTFCFWFLFWCCLYFVPIPVLSFLKNCFSLVVFFFYSNFGSSRVPSCKHVLTFKLFLCSLEKRGTYSSNLLYTSTLLHNWSHNNCCFHLMSSCFTWLVFSSQILSASFSLSVYFLLM